MKLFRYNTKRHELDAFSKAVEKLERIVLVYDFPALHSSILEIPSSHYVELRHNVKARQVEHKDQILYKFEEPYRDIIGAMDYEKNLVVLVQFDLGEGFPPHHHPMKEVIHCIKGSYRDGVSNIVYTEGDTQNIYPLQIHSFFPLEKGFAIIELQKN